MRSSNASQAHPYKIFLCSDESLHYKVSHVDNKNPSVYWRTDKPCASAFFEIKFPKAKITGIDLMNMFSPQLSVTVFNMDEKGEPTDQYECIPRMTLIPVNDYLSGKVDSKMRKYDFKDRPRMANKEYSFMRVTVYNPYHEEKPTYLGLVTLILFAKAEELKANQDTPSKLAFRQQLDKDVTENLMRSIGFNQRDIGTRMPSYLAATKRDTLFDDIEDADKPIINPRRASGRGIDEQGTVLKRAWHDMNNSEGVKPYYGAETKKLKPNSVRDGEMRRLKTFADQEKNREDDDLKRALAESAKSFKEEQEQRQSMDNQKWDYTNTFLSKKQPKERDRGDMAFKNEEKTQDLDDFKKAMAESRKMYNQENGFEGDEMDETLIETTKQTGENFYKKERLFEEKEEEKKENLFVGFGLAKRRDELTRKVSVENPEEVKEYYEMLEKCAEDEEEELGKLEEVEDMEEGEEYRNKEEDDLTDILENSMANLWADSQDQDKEKEMELELMDDFAQPKTLNFQNENYGDRVPQRTYYNLYKSFDHMITLTKDDYTTEYLQMEMKAKKELENKQGKGKGVEVVSSHQDILKGVVFSLGGFSGDEKKHLKDMTVSMGARFLDELYQGVTTHLVTKDANINKYQTAKNMKNVLIVSKEWVESCYELKKRLAETDFAVSEEQEYE